MVDDDLGRSGTTNRYETERDIRAALEDRSSDPIRTAFWTLCAPSRPWLAKLLNSDEIEELGSAALERYAETLSVSAADYSDILDHVADPFSYEWQPSAPFATVPVGCTS
jgi:hypothetical protein